MKVDRAGGSVGRGGIERGTPSAGKAGGAAAVPEVKVHASQFASELTGVTLRQVQGEIADLVPQVDAAADRLKREHSVYNLREYKSLVKGFLAKVLESLYTMEAQEMKQTARQRVLGETKYHLLAKQIDRELEQLADDVLNRTKGAIEIAARLDGIKGLLMDLLS